MTPSPTWRPPAETIQPRVVSITARQADILTGLWLGLTNRQVGRRLDISEDTVKTHTKRLYRALGARDRSHAVALTASDQVIVHVRSAA